MADYCIGLISGTSVDGIDAALFDCTPPFKLVATSTRPFAHATRAAIAALCAPGNNEIERMQRLDLELGRQFAAAANDLLRKADIPPHNVRAIGSHGQTIRHSPPDARDHGYSVQIGDPNTIAELTGITTIADFRRRDMAAGGHGAPLAPLFHAALVDCQSSPVAFLNLGGIANLTIIDDRRILTAFDTGPANGLMDAWIQANRNLPLDRNGQWAGSGVIDPPLLSAMLADEYFALAPPKSTGREKFNLGWIRKHFGSLPEPPAEDVQATLLELTIRSILAGLENAPRKVNTVYCCGGGVHNRLLMRRLRDADRGRTITTTAELGIGPDWLEACAFAWLAWQHLNGTSVDTTTVTGARHPVRLGCTYYP